jgi:acyl-ACP thioesterase
MNADPARPVGHDAIDTQHRAAGHGDVQAVGPAFVPRPEAGRVFTASRGIRSTDATSRGRLRLDALARYLQDVAEDDVADAGLRDPQYWLLRRSAVAIRAYPRLGEDVTLSTFCTATGPRWAERTTTLATADGDIIQTVALWVAVGRADGRPAALTESFLTIYGVSTAGRTVSARLSLPGPPPEATARPWPVRATDFDTAGHVNNSVHWAAAEDVLAPLGWRPASAEIEYQRPVLPGCEPALSASHQDGQAWAWLTDGSRRLASIRLDRDPPLNVP